MTRLIATLAMAVFGLAALPSDASADAEVYKNVLKSTAWVLAKNSGGTSSGTGVLVDQERKWVITNAHVVGDARNTVIFFPDMNGGSPEVSRAHYLKKENVPRLGIRGQVIGIDRKRDLALVQLTRLPEGVQAIELAPESVSPGATVHSVGNPGASGALWIYSHGKVRSVYQKKFRTGAGEHDFRVVETDSQINSGDSGGPVVNNEGQLVAVAQAIAPKARAISYFVDISEIKFFLNDPSRKMAPLPIAELLKTTELEYTKHSSGHYEVSFDVDDAEDKEDMVSVFITKDVEYYERADVRKIWALTQVLKEAPSSEITLKLLQQSARTKIGAWTIEQNQNGEYMVIYCVKIDATASAPALKSTMEYVAKLSAATKKDLAKQQQETTTSLTDILKNWLSN
jgi:serine protease Do